MPLVRYELQNEYNLADSKLLSDASTNDPGAILDGIAIASLVGLVRQLGNLVHFAGDLFHELHEEIKATAVRGHELVARMQQIEADLPVVEKTLLSETNPPPFTYSTGAEWHPRIYVHENHCSEGDLPQFVQNYYKKCRNPPKFYLLDKFDSNGAGACQKRYSNPSFFKAEWASIELKKAERVLKDRKALQIKKKHDYKGIRRAQKDAYEPLPPPRRVQYLSLSSGIWGTFSDISTPCSDGGTEPKMSEICTQNGETEGSQGLSKRNHLPPAKLQTLREFLKIDEDLEILRLSAKEIEAESHTARCKGLKVICEFQQKAIATVREKSNDKEGNEESASEADQFMDAMTTMESETESESGDRKEFIYNPISMIACGAECDSLKQENACVQEVDLQPEGQLDNPVLPHVSLTTGSPPFSADIEANISLDSQVQAQNFIVQPIEGFSKDAIRGRRMEMLHLSTMVDAICPDSTMHQLLSVPRVPSENEKAETVQERLCLSQASTHIYAECLTHGHPKLPSLSAGMPSPLLAENCYVTELDTDGHDTRPVPETLYVGSSNISSRLHEFLPSSISADLCGKVEIEFSDANSSSSASSPRSPLFSALNSPMSPIKLVCTSISAKFIRTAAATMLRPSSPTFESRILPPPVLNGIPPTPPPLPPLSWTSKQALHSSPGQSLIIMQACPTPPPVPPPPTVLSNEVQPIHQAAQTSRSTLQGQIHDALIKSLSAYDRTKLRKVAAAERQLVKPKMMDEILLEQIRAKSFRLRHTPVQKHDATPRPKLDMLQVAAIHEKASAIRQAFSGSDEDDANQGWTEVDG